MPCNPESKHSLEFTTHTQASPGSGPMAAADEYEILEISDDDMPQDAT